MFPTVYNANMRIVQGPGRRDHLRDDSRHARHPDRRRAAVGRRPSAATSAIRAGAGKATRWSWTSTNFTEQDDLSRLARDAASDRALHARGDGCATRSPWTIRTRGRSHGRRRSSWRRSPRACSSTRATRATTRCATSSAGRARPSDASAFEWHARPPRLLSTGSRASPPRSRSLARCARASRAAPRRGAEPQHAGASVALVDRSLAGSGAFAAARARAGPPRRRVRERRGRRLDARARAALARGLGRRSLGHTSAATLFCLDFLARDYGARTVGAPSAAPP